MSAEETETEAPDDFADAAAEEAPSTEDTAEAAPLDDDLVFTDEVGTNRFLKRELAAGADQDETIAPAAAPADDADVTLAPDPEATIAPAPAKTLAPPRPPASAAPPPAVLKPPAGSAGAPGRLAAPPPAPDPRLAASSSGKFKALGAPPPAAPKPQAAAPSAVRSAAASSGKQPAAAASSGKHQALAGSGTNRGLPRPGSRPERSREEDAAAIAALDARVVAHPAGDPFAGKDLGPFRVVGFLEADRGERRYKALLNETQRVVLLRVFPQAGALAGAWLEELKRVAERGDRACRIESPNLESAISAGKARDAFYAAFDPPLGPTLAEVLAEGPLDEAEALQMIEQVSRGLQALHQREMVHGHVSPAAIRRPRPGTFVLEGAGLGRPAPALAFLSHGGDVLGVPGHIAPEALEGEPRPAADLYALGVTAWTCLSHRPPFAGDDEGKVALEPLGADVPPVAPPAGRTVSPATAAIVAKLCGRHPDVRYKDVKDLVADLRARERGEAIQPFPAWVKPVAPTLRARRSLQGSTLATAILVVLNLVLLGLVVSTFKRVQETKMPDPLEGFTIPLGR